MLLNHSIWHTTTAPFHPAIYVHFEGFPRGRFNILSCDASKWKMAWAAPFFLSFLSVSNCVPLLITTLTPLPPSRVQPSVGRTYLLLAVLGWLPCWAPTGGQRHAKQGPSAVSNCSFSFLESFLVQAKLWPKICTRQQECHEINLIQISKIR